MNNNDNIKTRVRNIFNKPSRDQARIAELLKMIEVYWQQPKNTDQRLCQLLSNIVNIHISKTNDLYYIEDQSLIEAFNEARNENKQNFED